MMGDFSRGLASFAIIAKIHIVETPEWVSDHASLEGGGL
jgi:hypothetical protein